MAREIQRAFHHDRRVIEVIVEDDLGAKHFVACHVGDERCPHCKRDYPKNPAGTVDFEALVKSVCAELSVETDRAIAIFERHGADMTKAKEARMKRLK